MGFLLLVKLPKNLKFTVICAQDGTQNLPFFSFLSVLISIFHKTNMFLVKLIIYFQFCKNKTGYKKRIRPN